MKSSKKLIVSVRNDSKADSPIECFKNMIGASLNTAMPLGFRIMTVLMICSGALMLIGLNIQIAPDIIFEEVNNAK